MDVKSEFCPLITASLKVFVFFLFLEILQRLYRLKPKTHGPLNRILQLCTFVLDHFSSLKRGPLLLNMTGLICPDTSQMFLLVRAQKEKRFIYCVNLLLLQKCLLYSLELCVIAEQSCD